MDLYNDRSFLPWNLSFLVMAAAIVVGHIDTV